MKSKITKQEFNKESDKLIGLSRFVEDMSEGRLTSGNIRYDKLKDEWGMQMFITGTDKNIQIFGTINQIRNSAYELITDMPNYERG